jgi:hypothetical protein
MPLRLLRRQLKNTKTKQLTQQQRTGNPSPPIRRHPIPRSSIAKIGRSAAPFIPASTLVLVIYRSNNKKARLFVGPSLLWRDSG